jgi:hypothetical protein
VKDAMFQEARDIRYPQYFYLLPKVHKSPPSSRPIISNRKWVLAPLARACSQELQDVVKQIPYILKNSSQLVRDLDYKHIGANSIIATVDIESMYTNINVNYMLRNLREVLDMFGMMNVKKAWIIPAIELITRHNIFKIQRNNNHHTTEVYQQRNGLPMGSSVSPALANLHVFMKEQPWLKRFDQYIFRYYRYLDDILIIFNTSNVDMVKQILSALETELRMPISYNLSMGEINYLDLHIMRIPVDAEGKSVTIQMKTYHKMMNMYMFIPFRSCHTLAMKKGWIIGELIRYVRNSSTQELYEKTRDKFIAKLIQRGYCKVQKYTKQGDWESVLNSVAGQGLERKSEEK